MRGKAAVSCRNRVGRLHGQSPVVERPEYAGLEIPIPVGIFRSRTGSHRRGQHQGGFARPARQLSRQPCIPRVVDDWPRTGAALENARGPGLREGCSRLHFTLRLRGRAARRAHARPLRGRVGAGHHWPVCDALCPGGRLSSRGWNRFGGYAALGGHGGRGFTRHRSVGKRSPRPPCANSWAGSAPKSSSTPRAYRPPFQSPCHSLAMPVR